MDPVVAAAFIDGSPSTVYADRRILGARLRKFCNWHRLLLNAADSPFMRKGAVTMSDLRVAVGICRLTYQRSRVRRPWIVPAWVYTRALTASVLRRKLRPIPDDPESKQNHLQRALKRHVDSFLNYTKDYLQDPEFVVIPPPVGKNHTPQTPRGRFDDCIEQVGELIKFGIPERRAWEMPIGMARIYRIMALRSDGNDIDVTTQEEVEFRKTVPPQFKIAK